MIYLALLVVVVVLWLFAEALMRDFRRAREAMSPDRERES